MAQRWQRRTEFDSEMLVAVMQPPALVAMALPMLRLVLLP